MFASAGRPCIIFAAVMALAAIPPPAWAQSPENVLLVINDSSADSVQIGDYYARIRSLGPQNIVHIKAVTDDAITRRIYQDQIALPVGRWIARYRLHDQILYIVLTKGIPLRITGTAGREGTAASVDSELTLLYRRLVAETVPEKGRVANPYYLGASPLAAAKPFNHIDFDIFLVTRLDGFSVDDVLRLIDRGMTPSESGSIVLEQKAAPSGPGGDRWLGETAQQLQQSAWRDRVALQRLGDRAGSKRDALGYYTWRTADLGTAAQLPEFVPGAIAATYAGTDGRTFTQPPSGWQRGSWADQKTWYEGSPEPLAGDLIRAGITGLGAHVTEPYMDAAIRPQVLFAAYLAGFNLAESFYLATPALGWQAVIVGDPLCAPFGGVPVPEERLHRGIDPESDQATLFTNRRLALVPRNIKQDAVKLAMRAEMRLREGNRAGARELYERVTQLEPVLTNVYMQLAFIHEEDGEHEAAIAAYKRLLALAPSDVAALNNLAYALADRVRRPEEALPIAVRAYGLAPGPQVADTLGWTHFLLGHTAEAVTYLQEAGASPSASGETLYHLAAALARAARNKEARAALDRAVSLAPELRTRDDVAALARELP